MSDMDCSLADARTIRRPQLAHTLRVTWSAHGGEMYEEWSVDCPYPLDDYDKPCRVWASEDDHTGESEPGCWVWESLENGIECVGIDVPPRSVAPWSVYVAGSGDEGPRLIEVSLANPDPPTPENVETP